MEQFHFQGLKRNMNAHDKILFMMGFDGLRGCIFSESFTDFGECEEQAVKDTACDALFPGELQSLDATHDKKLYVSTSEKLCHRSKIPRLMKSNTGKKASDRLFPYRDPESMIKISENRNERLSMKRSKLPIREIYSNGFVSRVNSINIDGKRDSLDPRVSSRQNVPVEKFSPIILNSKTPEDSIPPEKSKIDEVRRFTRDARKFERAQETGVKIGQKISRLLEHIKKKQTAPDLANNSGSAMSIMKRALRLDLTTKTIPQAQRNIFPQFYIGSTPSEFKLFRCGDEWNHL